MNDKQKKISDEFSDAINHVKKGAVASTANAKFADYSDADLDPLPKGIAENSFGCGNPIAFSNVQPGQTVLDLGCGAGLDLLLAAEKVGKNGRVIGVDMNTDMLAKAKANINHSGFTNIELKQGQIEDLPIESGSVDWVISNCVINLSLDKQKAFSEISRVLKPGGKFLISDIVAENLPWWVRRGGVLAAACIGGVISEKEYLNGLKAAGISESTVVARQHYDPVQIASVGVGALPQFIRKISCCGVAVANHLITKVATPISKNLWSAKFLGKIV